MSDDDANFDYLSDSPPPGIIFVAADEPLLVYPSVLAAERHLEAEDVRNGVYPAAYGINGEPYQVRSEGSTVMVEMIGEPSRPGELKSLLIRYLAATGNALDMTATLDDLVATVWAVESEFWQEHDPYGERFGTRIPGRGCVAFLIVTLVVFYLVMN